MICYRDMTFCTFYKSCKDGESCERALTPKVKKEAEEWMGRDAPICLFGEKPECWEKKT